VTIATISSIDRDFPRFSGLAAGSRGVTSPTVARGAAILLWLLGPVLAVAALAVPPFLLLAIAFGCGFVVFAARGLSGGRPVGALFALPSGGGVALGLFGIVGAGLFWLLALRLIAAPDGAAVAHPWPVLGAAIAGLTGQAAPGPGAAGGPALGYVFVLCGALCWIATGATRRRASAPIGRVCGIAAPLCFVLHLCLEPRLSLDAASLLAAAALGLGPLGIAHLLWDRGTCRGDVPVFSAARRRDAGGR
jgi:drug/metabolite transporter (DMT)-like permease